MNSFGTPLFRSASLRLTLWYLLILMVLSGLFSGVLYQVSTQEFNREIRRFESMQQSTLFAPRGFTEFRRLRLEEIAQSKQHILMNLVYFNVVILVAGGGLSYLLAQRTLEPIEESLEAQHRFITDASHELRTPLTAMKTELEVALRDKNLTFEESKQLHASNLEEVGKLETLANNLLKLAKPPTQAALHAFETCQTGDIIQAAITKIAPLAKSKEIVIDNSVRNSEIEGDERSLTELFTILLDNAIKYSPSHTKVTISNTIKRKQKEIIFHIDDEGIGIKASDFPHIFERFYRADASRSKQIADGHGLGLAIAKKITEMHHGSIDATPRTENGTRFTVTLPISQPSSRLAE
ncbi:MAG TPA: HAMP domain-containing sensor histidine kinase [Patescibacteria group bacterium]